MGYRIDVMALVYPDAIESTLEERAKYEQLKVLMATTFKDVSDKFGDPFMTWMDKDCVLKFDIRDVKWYPSYPDVMMLTDMLETLGCDDVEEGGIPGYCTEFIRIGEDNTDVDEEHRGEDNQYYLTVRRSIDCNV
ncbi:MAG: hypothetical protein ACKO0Z_01800 [Betaproteobacteria bacterium]